MTSKTKVFGFILLIFLAALLIDARMENAKLSAQIRKAKSAIKDSVVYIYDTLTNEDQEREEDNLERYLR